MRRVGIVFVTAAVATGLSVPLASAGPEPGGPTVDTSQSGNTSGVTLRNSKVGVNGDGRGGVRTGPVEAPKCWYEPAYTPGQMLRFVQDNAASTEYAFDPGLYRQHIDQINKVKATQGKDGRWWGSAGTATAAGLDCMTGLEPYVFVPTGQAPPAAITAFQLAQLARAALTVDAPTIQTSPTAKSYVQLDTHVWTTLAGGTTRTATASLPGVASATVTARAGNLTIIPGTSAARAEVHNNCGATGYPYTAGAPLRCGVKYLRASKDQPGEVYTLQAALTWTITWAGSGITGGPTSGTFAPTTVTGSKLIPVGEIQSVVKP